MVAVVTIFCLFSFSACTKEPEEVVGGSYGYTGSVEGVGFTLPDLGGSVSLHTQPQRNYIALSDKDGVSAIARGVEEMSMPLPVSFEWATSGNAAVDYTLKISESPTMEDALTYVATDARCDVYNLKVGTRYFWTVTANAGDRRTESGVASFTTTSLLPRTLYVDGVTNCRDLGGYKTADGKTLNQGYIYRTGRLNSSNKSECIPEITEKGVRQALYELGFKTEIDLRKRAEASGITSSVLGDSVDYVACPMDYGTDILVTGAEEIKRVFSVLGRVESYPVFFHCHIGTDRTGLIAYLINGALGVEKEDLYTDYLFSNFGNIGGSRSKSTIDKKYVETLDRYDGETLKEKIESYLFSIGVTEEDLFVLRYIMIYQ